jgi:hypothetical protein
MTEEKLRVHFGDYLGKAEVAIYSILAVLLFVAGLATIANAGKLFWDGLIHWTIATQTLRVLDQLLVVLMLVEILHTVRISIRSHILVTEPFLGCGSDCLDSAHPRDYFGSEHPHQRWNVVDRGCKYISRYHD